MKRMKNFIIAMLTLTMVMSLTACGGGKAAADDTPEVKTEAAAENGAESTAKGDEPIKVAFCTVGLGDLSINDSAWEGVQKAAEEFGVEASVVEVPSGADNGTALLTAVNSGADLVITVGAAWSDSIDEYAPRFPEVKFCGLNCFSAGDYDNFSNAITADHEGSFLVGYLAAKMSKTGIVGGVGATETSNIQRFMKGYEEGAKYANPDVEVLIAYTGTYSDGAKGKEFAKQLINEGADVLYHVASATGLGMFEAIGETEDVYGIGVDCDQDHLLEGRILTSMVKNCDVVAYDFIEDFVDGTWKSGKFESNVGNGGVGLTEMKYTRDLIGEDILSEIEDVKAKIASGEIVVTDILEN